MTAPRGPEEREFTIGQVLTVACADLEAQQLFCTWREYLDIVAYLLNDVPSINGDPDADPPMPPLWRLVEAQARPAVLAQLPELAGVRPPNRRAGDVTALSWLAQQETQHGPQLTLRAPR